MADAPMKQTNVDFYNLINNEDWDFDFSEFDDVEDIDVNISQPIMQYWIPSPMPGVFLRVDFTMEQNTSKRELMDFLNNLNKFLDDELGEHYG